MATIQEALYTIEVGRGRVWIQRLAILVGFVALSMLYTFGQFNGLATREAFGAAQLARQLARGEGYTTKILQPSQIALWQSLHADEPLPEAFPEMSEAPVYPVLLSLAFRITGVPYDVDSKAVKEMRIYQPELVIVFFNQLCVLLTTLLVYFWGRRQFDERVGLLAAVVFVLSDMVWQFAISGLSTSWVVLLLTAQFLCVAEALRAEEEQRNGAVWGWLTGAAVILSLGILSRAGLFCLVPVHLFLVGICFRARWGVLSLTVAVVLAVTGPWVLRQKAVTGSYAGTAAEQMRAGVYENQGTILERTYSVEPKGSLFKGMVFKLVTGTKYYFEHYLQLAGAGVAVLFFVVGLFHGFRRWPTRMMRFYLVALVLVGSWGAILLSAKPEVIGFQNGLALFWPALALFGCAYFYVILDRLDIDLQVLKSLIVALFGFLGAIPMVLTLLPPGVGTFRYPPYFPPIIKLASAWLTPDEVMVSDMPWATAWYGDRRSLWLPASPDQYYSLHGSVLRTQGMLLTPVTANEPLLSVIDRGEYKEWASIIRRQGLPVLFPLGSVTPLPPNDTDYLFMSDRVRWR